VSALTGTGTVVGLALRRDRVVLPVWIAVFVATAAASAGTVGSLYPDVGSRIRTAAAVNATPVLLALYGRVFDPTSPGELAMLKLGGFGGALVAVLTMLTVIRHSRTEEESGRQELLGAAVLGRGAPLAAALAVGAGTALVLGAATAVVLVAAGLPVDGSVAFGAAWAACGIVFAAVGGVTAQLARGARAAIGLSTVAVVGAFLLRAAGDTAGPSWLSWLSPIGWGLAVRRFAGARWWVLLLPLGSALLLAALAHRLGARRDLGAGLLPDRAGPAAAAPGLRSPLALAWRLHRGVLAAWAVGFTALGALLGSIAAGAGELLSSPEMRQVILALGGEQALTDAFLAAELGFMGVFASVYAVQAALRLPAEERAGRADPVLAVAVSRLRWAGGHLVLAALGTATLLAAAGLGAGLAHGANTGDLGGEVVRLVGAALAQLPAALVVGAVVVALFGLAPRLVAAGWLVLAGCLLIGELGPLLSLPRWVKDLSPFTHLPRLPGAEVAPGPLLWLTAVALALTAAGLLGIRRRDLG
jgi:ABC-2 type transport system permease protein